jgi:hypothetical protein
MEDFYILRLWDMFDGWIDIEDNLTPGFIVQEVNNLLNEKTENGTIMTSFNDGDYYCVFPSDTKMYFTPEKLGR